MTTEDASTSDNIAQQGGGSRMSPLPPEALRPHGSLLWGAAPGNPNIDPEAWKAGAAPASLQCGRNRRIQIGLRHHSGDSLRHAYRVILLSAIEARRIHEIRPVCHEMPAGVLGLTHIFDMINRTPFKNLGGPFNACTPCGIWLAAHPHEIIVMGEVVAVHDVLEDILEPRWPRRERVDRLAPPVQRRCPGSPLAGRHAAGHVPARMQLPPP